MTTEVWKDVSDYKGVYQVSNMGHLRRIKRAQGASVGKILKGRKNRDGYITFSFWNSPKPPTDRLVHVVVLTEFVGPRPHGMECRHLNGIPFDNRLSNLKWGTPVDNAKDRTNHGNTMTGEAHTKSRLTEVEVDEIRASTKSQRALAREFGVTQQHISDIKTGKRWKK